MSSRIVVLSLIAAFAGSCAAFAQDTLPVDGPPPLQAPHFSKAVIAAPYNNSSQTLSPDAKTLSILFTGLRAETKLDGLQAATAGVALMLPLTSAAGEPLLFVKLDVRGDVSPGGSGSFCRLGISTLAGSNSSFFSADAAVQEELTLQLPARSPGLVVTVLLECLATGADPGASALLEIDSIDVTLAN